MQLDGAKLIRNIEELKKKPTDVDPAEEVAYLTDLLDSNPVLAQRFEEYENAAVAGVGGSGVILKAVYKPSGVERAIKFPRKRQYEAAANTPDADPERAALEKVSHQNITRLYETIQLPNKGSYCMITQFIPGDDNSLDDYVARLFCTSECRESDEHLNRSLRQFARIIYDISSAMRYLHTDAKLLHFDIKPDNILVSPTGTPFVTDLGFAREIDRYAPDEKVEVGFTWKYAHPKLQNPELGALITKVPQKSKKPLLGADLSPIFDVFAFGRTLQEALGILLLEFGERIQAFYIFDYLHVLACLCLDGRNAPGPAPTHRGEFVPDSALGLAPLVYARSKLADFSGVHICVERLLGVRRFEDDLPEVDRWYGSTIKISESGSTTLTPRVASLLNHPALERLKRERQLGMLDNVFPTATHTRFQHAVGSYHAATLYLAALYYDPENPLFRALVDINKCKALLIAALIHDIGQTAYGHELEEIDDEIYDHKQYAEIIVTSESFKDEQGRTVRDIIESEGDGCWQLSLSAVLAVFKKLDNASIPFDGVLHDILDSQIDADKFDYLVRDSVEARVSYGLGLDLDRFLRSLTTFAGQDGTLQLAVKQKGAASAEAFGHARYQLYQSMYWHHTFRATKAMLLEAVHKVSTEVEKLGDDEMFDRYPLRSAYIREVLGAREYSPSGRGVRRKEKRASKVPDLRSKIDDRLAAVAPRLSIRYKDDDFIIFMMKLTSDPKAKALISDLVGRSYYKRVLEVSPAKLSMAGWERFRDRFKKHRSSIQEAVEGKLLNALRGRIQSVGQERASLQVNDELVRLNSIANRKAVFLVDVPLRGWFSDNEAPTYVSDYKRRHFRTDAASETRSDFWNKSLGESMKAAAYIRVYCEPEVHSLMLSVMRPEHIYLAVQEAIPELPKAL